MLIKQIFLYGIYAGRSVQSKRWEDEQRMEWGGGGFWGLFSYKSSEKVTDYMRDFIFVGDLQKLL